jgi:hypothetical protein
MWVEWSLIGALVMALALSDRVGVHAGPAPGNVATRGTTLHCGNLERFEAVASVVRVPAHPDRPFRRIVIARSARS